MATSKIERFEEVKQFPNCFYHSFEQSLKGSVMKGKWNENYFNNNNPIVLELGCGKGEYTVGLGKKYVSKNFIGVDIKGNRIWKGAKESLENNIKNVAFLRTRIDFIESCFAANEVSEIWITFPDPQPQKTRERKRLVSTMFTNRYKKLIVPGGLIHLKTDSEGLYLYALEIIKQEGYSTVLSTANLYNETLPIFDEAKGIQTFYESIYLKKGVPIKYIQFKIS
ncbi:MAG: tRNA (guanosine(46)-N7)-methyltransferase TrmB [Bacteroidetes bacterium]|nr:tRNA (guanosine(46)-N7)-methyltransferase TrmB [Bacteroidota bacterium]